MLNFMIMYVMSGKVLSLYNATRNLHLNSEYSVLKKWLAEKLHILMFSILVLSLVMHTFLMNLLIKNPQKRQNIICFLKLFKVDWRT